MNKTIKKLFKESKGFRTLKGLKTYIEKNKECPDFIRFKGIPFEMEEYDMAGKEITYYNKDKDMSLTIEWNNNRYQDWKDIKEIYITEDRGFWRNGFNYYTA